MCSDEILGVAMLQSITTLTTNVQTTEETECIAIPYAYCKHEIETKTIFLKHINLLLAKMVSGTSANAVINQLSSLESRLCMFIELNNKDNIFKTNLTDLAEMLGTSYRHLLRTLNILCKDKILRKEKEGYVIVDIEQLRAKGEKSYIDI